MDDQEILDRKYFENGPCCAGCDFWETANTSTGQCRKSAPVSGAERVAAIGIKNVSIVLPAGHVLTFWKDYCGDFKDDFDWSSLPPAYRRRVGCSA